MVKIFIGLSVKVTVFDTCLSSIEFVSGVMLLQLTLPKLTIESPVEKSQTSYVHPTCPSVPGPDPSTGKQAAQISLHAECFSTTTFSFNLTEISEYRHLVSFPVSIVLNLFGSQWLVLCINSRHPDRAP